jgi:hypothetical protein
MREIISHRSGLPDLNSLVRIEAGDDPETGQQVPKNFMNRSYSVSLRAHNEWSHNVRVKFNAKSSRLADGSRDVNFVPDGLTTEALLAIALDRLQGAQKREFSCRENAIAITHLEEAMHWLHHRTRDRANREVEGVLQK